MFGCGDCEVLQAWGNPMYSAGGDMCGCCKTNRSSLPFTDLRANSLWHDNMVNNLEFIARTKVGHPIAQSRYWNYMFPRYDAMHCADHHGVSGVFAGSVLERLVKDPRLGPNQQARMDTINMELKQHFDAHVVSSRMPPLRLDNLKTAGWFELSSPLIKAANTRHFMPFCESLCLKYFNRGTQYDIAATKAVCHLNGFYHVIYTAAVFLSDAEKALLKHHLEQMGKYHMLCRQYSDDLEIVVWQVKPKAHYCQHFFHQCCLINSRWTQCYSQESMVGKMVKMWRTSIAGQYAPHVQKTVCTKYLIQFCILFNL